jgi:hypothetical protein
VQANLSLRDDFKLGKDIHLAFVSNKMAEVEYQHWFLSDGVRHLEFGASTLSVYDARVNINTTVRDFNVVETKPMDEAMRIRMGHVLGMRNYSLCLRCACAC